jgi:hypothetical protein
MTDVALQLGRKLVRWLNHMHLLDPTFPHESLYPTNMPINPKMHSFLKRPNGKDILLKPSQNKHLQFLQKKWEAN